MKIETDNTALPKAPIGTKMEPNGGYTGEISRRTMADKKSNRCCNMKHMCRYD